MRGTYGDRMHATEGRGFDPGRLAAVDEITHGYVDDGRLPCAVTAVIHRGEEVHRDAYGWADCADSLCNRVCVLPRKAWHAARDASISTRCGGSSAITTR